MIAGNDTHEINSYLTTRGDVKNLTFAQGQFFSFAF